MLMIFTTLFSGAWGGVKRMFGMALRYPWQAALIVAVLACGWLYWGKADALATVSKRDATIVALTKASDQARAAQIVLNTERTSKETEIARNADNDETTRRDIADRSRAYADGMRSKDYCRKASATTEDRLAEAYTSAGPDAIVVSADDFRILTDNTARLVEVRAWGQKLVDEGLAVPVD